MSDKLAPAGKYKYIHDGKTIYEWDQTLSEVNIYIEVPKGVKAKQLFVNISSSHISVGIHPNPPYLDKDLSELVKAGESYWTLEDGILHLQLCKVEKGQPWKSAIAGHVIDPVQAESEKQRLLLERFQEEHPGFDFSGAIFNGEAPNPRTFMGGMSSA